MIELVSRNVLLKGSNRRQILSWLKRSLRLGEQVGNLAVKITVQRIGKTYQVMATVKDQAGVFLIRTHARELMDACREIVRVLSLKLHNQRLQKIVA